MDVKDLLDSRSLKPGDRIEVSGWLVDTSDGLYILGDHWPENYEYPYRVKIANGNIMYPILEQVPSLGGGWSLIFYRAKISAVVECCLPWILRAENICVEPDRGSGRYVDVDVRPEIVSSYVKNNGEYKFERNRNPVRDWLDD
ncbi:hypothetical protein AB3K92_35345 [Burkholderia sp. Bmkn7]|uniref:hypothetical protein n=1 Tax=Burkholderia sp. Bmkn7 TaxID=3236841 RepID=UPI0034E4960D